MLIVSVVGTRPNFVKEYLISSELKKNGIREVLVHTGQHYDYEMSRKFFEDFELPDPNYHLTIRGKTNVEHTAIMMNFMEEVLAEEKPNAVLVYGDVNSTLAAAIVSAKLEIPLIHIEGGVRSNKLYNPEEINRRVTDSLSELIFASTKTDYENLVKENYHRERIYRSGDLMKDTVLRIMENNKYEIDQGDYHVCTIHRQENVEVPKRLESIIEGLVKSGEKIIFPVHPRTINRLEKYGLIGKISGSKIELVTPKGYKDFIKLLAGSNKVLTDSGGVRREAYILGKPIVLLIDLVWFPEILEAGWAYIASDDPKRIVLGIKEFFPQKNRPNIFGDGYAYKKIVGKITERFRR